MRTSFCIVVLAALIGSACAVPGKHGPETFPSTYYFPGHDYDLYAVEVMNDDPDYLTLRATMERMLRAVGGRDYAELYSMYGRHRRGLVAPEDVFRQILGPESSIHNVLFSEQLGPLRGGPLIRMPQIALFRTIDRKTGADVMMGQIDGCVCRVADCTGRWQYFAEDGAGVRTVVCLKLVGSREQWWFEY